MKFVDIRERIVFKTLDEIRKAGYRIVKKRNGDRFLPSRTN